MSWPWAQGTWEQKDTHQTAAQGLVSPAGLSLASNLGPANLVPSLPQGSPGMKGATGPVGPPGASVSGPPVRAPLYSPLGILLGLRAFPPGRGHGADLARHSSMGDGRREASAQPSVEVGRPHCLQWRGGGVSLKNDSIDHHQFLSSDHAEACAKTEFNLILTTAL